MAAAEVDIQEHGPGRATVTVNGVKLPAVRAVKVEKRHGNLDIVTVELVSQRTTMTADASPEDLAAMKARDAEIDAAHRASGTVPA